MNNGGYGKYTHGCYIYVRFYDHHDQPEYYYSNGPCYSTDLLDFIPIYGQIKSPMRINYKGGEYQIVINNAIWLTFDCTETKYFESKLK